MSTNNDGWILMSERKPTEADLPVWGWMRGTFAPYLCLTMPHNDWTHWKPAAGDIPAPPREKTQEDKDNDALLEWIGALGLPPTNVCVWEAALAYERAEVGKMLPTWGQLMGGRTATENAAAIEAIRARCGGAK